MQLIGFIIGLLFFVAIIGTYASNKEERDRYYQLENKRRRGGKGLLPAELEEWVRLAKKYKW